MLLFNLQAGKKEEKKSFFFVPHHTISESVKSASSPRKGSIIDFKITGFGSVVLEFRFKYDTQARCHVPDMSHMLKCP